MSKSMTTRDDMPCSCGGIIMALFGILISWGIFVLVVWALVTWLK